VRARVARVWRAPLWAHAVALAVVLIALMPIVGTSTSLSADEGAAIVQARSLADGNGWVLAHPFPAVDPSGAWYPLDLATRARGGYIALAKHPLYPAVLSIADRLGGINGMVLLSVAGAVLAAFVAALLTRRWLPGWERVALWTVGIGSPLLFDAQLVIAHTMGAALLGAATLAVIVGVSAKRWWPLAGAFVAMLAAAMLRSESLLWAGAFAVAAAGMAWRRRSRWWAAGGVCVAAGAVAGWAVDHVWARAIVGSA